MQQIQLRPEIANTATHLCQRCGHAMRLIGSEPHPAISGTDLLTYCCTACDDFLVLPFEGGENR